MNRQRKVFILLSKLQRKPTIILKKKKIKKKKNCRGNYDAPFNDFMDFSVGEYLNEVVLWRCVFWGRDYNGRVRGPILAWPIQNIK